MAENEECALDRKFQTIKPEQLTALTAKLKTKSAGGPDRIVNELLKYGSPRLHALILHYFKKLFLESTESMPRKLAGIAHPLQ